jgi:8-oxo-dGTP pyrophosphatase MutT (NUDIX family)
MNVSQKVIVFNNEGNVLALKRTKDAPSKPLFWDLPGGELDMGEDLKEGIEREVAEETGLEISEFNLLDAISGFNDKKEFWVTICYIAKSKSDSVKLSFEHGDFSWLSIDDFLQLKISHRQRRFMEKYKSIQTEGNAETK